MLTESKTFSTHNGRISTTPATSMHFGGSKYMRDHPSLGITICLACLLRTRFRSKRKSASVQPTGMRDLGGQVLGRRAGVDKVSWRKSYFFKLNLLLSRQKIVATDPEALASRDPGFQAEYLVPAGRSDN